MVSAGRALGARPGLCVDQKCSQSLSLPPEEDMGAGFDAGAAWLADGAGALAAWFCRGALCATGLAAGRAGREAGRAELRAGLLVAEPALLKPSPAICIPSLNVSSN